MEQNGNQCLQRFEGCDAVLIRARILGNPQGFPFQTHTTKTMTPNTQNLPGISADLSNADLAAERFRAGIGARQRLPEVPAEWQAEFTPETWSEFTRERFWCYHSHASILTPRGYLDGERESTID